MEPTPMPTPPNGRRLSTAAMTLGALAVCLFARVAPAEAQYAPYTDPCGVVTASSNCVRIWIKPSLEARNLHPDVNKAEMICWTKIGEPNAFANVTFTAAVSNRDVSF